MSMAAKLNGMQSRLRRYVVRYGMWKGVLTLARAVCGRGLVSIQLPGCKDSILLRRHTTDVAAFEQIFIDREYDFPLGQKDPKWIVDAGANVGCASVFFAKQFPRASILAIEPEVSNYSILEQNGKRFPNITTIRGAIWNSDAELEIQNPTDENWAFRVQETSNLGVPKVPAFSICSILNRIGADWIDILKVDIEGAEKELFDESSARWIDRVRVIIIELHDWIKPGCSEALSNVTSGINWERSRVGENTILIRR